MFALEHHVRVYVFQVLSDQVQYLLLRHKPAAEWPLGPVVGSIGPDEHMQDAVLREVEADTGIRKPLHLIDLSQPRKELFGDVGMVEWHFAYQAGAPDRPVGVVPGPRIGEYAWLGFEEAFRRIEHRGDRDVLCRVQLRLHGG